MLVSKDYEDRTTERFINTASTLPSPLRSSAGSRRACRKWDGRGGEWRERESSKEWRGKAREAERRAEGERRERLEHEKP